VDIKKLINQMTLEEKASLCSCKNLWETKGIERLGIPSITLADGPYGLVKRTCDFYEPIPATCFPTPTALAASWDVDLAYAVGKAIGEECLAEDVNILCGPAINIQRSPLSGRNFQYYSEDPVLSGEMGAAFINGIQSEGVGACVKHYIANNQESHRQNINNIIDEQALNELYLSNFERVVKKGNPFAVMVAYNKINGIPCAENDYLLTDILRNKWNFDGLILSDLYAINSIINSLQAGIDLELPNSPDNIKKIIEAVLSGTLDLSVLDNAIEDILNIIFKVTQDKKDCNVYDKEKHNNLAREAAENSIVLLKNKRNLLPLKRDRLKNKKIAIIGEYAKNPRYQGEGNANIIPIMFDNPYAEITKLVGNSIKVHYAQGYNVSIESTDDNNALLMDAKKAAKGADVAILFVGTPESYDAEYNDKPNMDLPANQVKLIKEIGKVQKNLIVVLSNGSPVIISPWAKHADAILETWLAGQASGGAIAEILFGIVTPSGKLPTTFPIQLSDTPNYLDSIDSENNLHYKEGIFVGYRYYDKRNMAVEFPFGFGLSYTTFKYSDLTLNKDVIKDNDTLEVKLKVRNTGKYFGKEVVELYIRNVASTVPRPEKELKAFAKIALFPGEEKEVSFALHLNDFSHYDINTNNWVVESGPYEILIGKSSRDIPLSKNIFVQSSYLPKTKYTSDTLAGEFLINSKAKPTIESLLNNAAQSITSDTTAQEKLVNYFKNIPISKFITLSNGTFTEKMLNDLLSSANET
jgi:beta-glucosidase